MGPMQVLAILYDGETIPGTVLCITAEDGVVVLFDTTADAAGEPTSTVPAVTQAKRSVFILDIPFDID